MYLTHVNGFIDNGLPATSCAFWSLRFADSQRQRLCTILRMSLKTRHILAGTFVALVVWGLDRYSNFRFSQTWPVFFWLLYILSLQRALSECAPGSRTASPATLWLMFVPLLNAIWGFVLMRRIAKSYITSMRCAIWTRSRNGDNGRFRYVPLFGANDRTGGSRQAE